MVGYLGSNPEHQPYGLQKFEWNAEQRRLEYAWTNNVISSPSSVPIVGMGSNRVYFIGARNNEFTLEALDWDSGNSDFHYVIGGQRYNVMYSGTAIDEDGRIHYGTPWGGFVLCQRPPLKRLEGEKRARLWNKQKRKMINGRTTNLVQCAS